MNLKQFYHLYEPLSKTMKLWRPSFKQHHVLGRWGQVNSNTQLDRKIDLANEDHCGPCGQYAMEQLEKKVESRLREVEKKTDEFKDFLTKH